MVYKGQQKKGIRWGSSIGTGLIVLFLFIVFVCALIWFRQPKKTVEDRIDSIATVLTPDPISQSILSGIIDTETKVAQIFLLSDSGQIGEAERGMKDDHSFFTIAAQLPEIDRAVFYYAVWLVQPLPYDYFLIGEMTTNEEGAFVLEWEGLYEPNSIIKNS